MRALKWRSMLMGDQALIKTLRKCKITAPFSIRDQEVMDNDLRRTFPQMVWYSEGRHMDNISTILMAYANVNENVGYAQGMCFIVFILYKVYYDDCPKYAIQDTYYSLHKIMAFLRPMYPRDGEDVQVAEWLKATTSVVRLKMLTQYPRLVAKLRGSGFVKLLILKTIPALFANWFKFDDIFLIWDHILSSNHFLENTLNIIVGMIVTHREIYLHFNEEKILMLMSEKSFYKASSVVSHAYTLQR